MERKFRLTRSDDFKRVRSSGKSYAHPLLVLITTPSQNPEARVGITASHSVGGAVERNRAKRLLREAVKPFLMHMRPDDLVLIARAPLADGNLSQASDALKLLLNRARLLKPDHE